MSWPCCTFSLYNRCQFRNFNIVHVFFFFLKQISSHRGWVAASFYFSWLGHVFDPQLASETNYVSYSYQIIVFDTLTCEKAISCSKSSLSIGGRKTKQYFKFCFNIDFPVRYSYLTYFGVSARHQMSSKVYLKRIHSQT